MLATLLIWLTARTPVDVRSTSETIPELARAREQIVTARLRAATLLGSVALSVTLALGLQHSLLLLAGYTIVVALSWVFALNRQIDYRLRGTVFVVATYLLALNELLHYGYSPNTILYLAGFALLPLSFLSWRVGVGALALAVSTLALVGFLLSSGAFQPLNYPAPELALSEVVSICLIFMIIVGAVQSGNFALRRSLEVGWSREHEARLRLEQAHDQLEQRVAERTAELAELNRALLAANQEVAAQSQYLRVLQQTTLDLLNHHTLPELYQEIVDRATAILTAPYGELMVHDGDGLVVQAFSVERGLLPGDRVARDGAPAAWQAFETRQSVVLADGAERLSALRAVAGFPILAGNAVLGVLTVGRGVGEPPFSPEQVQQGQLFAHMVGLVLERTRLYDRALSELAERTQAEQALRVQTEQLSFQNAELDAFAHTVAHDLATPLTGLVGCSELLKAAVAKGELKDVPTYSDIITRTGKKMAQIINEILLLASIRKQSDLTLGRLAMDAIVAEAELRLAHQIAAAQATISRPAAWPPALGYAPWVEEVWANYLDNALKYGGRPPQIALSADLELPGFVRFWVCDNGPGLSAEQQAQLFTSVTRFHTMRADGHGLGLSIVERIVTKLGGAVGVESTPGQGARFFFTLPRG